MKAIILSAGQGRRLLPLTADKPKCLLDVAGKTILEWQLDTLRYSGINEIVIVTGYGASQVQKLINRRYGGGTSIRTLYNPDYAVSDNLVSCWKARDEMKGDFLLLNGDTLFEPAVIHHILTCRETSITVTINSKDGYDEDDMKVQCVKNRLLHIGKHLPIDQVDGEAIGIIRFLDQGPEIFVSALEQAVSRVESRGKWYLSVIESLAGRMDVFTCSITGLRWCEVDFPEDLRLAGHVMDSAGSRHE